jgi:hypothetical protein
LKRSACALTLLLVGASAPASALTRDEVAKKFAPVVYQEVRDKRDLVTTFDFDGNWAGDDNGENVDCVHDPASCLSSSPCKTPGSCKLTGAVYYTVIETATHWFVQYMPYHPLDTKVTNGHEHDSESILATVAKAGEKLLAIEVRFHNEWYVYADASVTGNARNPDGPLHVDTAGHPKVYQQMVGHGICGGFSPPNYGFPDLQISCQHDLEPHVDKTGVVYQPDLAAGEPSIVPNQAVEVGYALVEILTTFWARRTEVGAGKTYGSLVDFTGERCDVLTCPKQFGGPFMGDQGELPSGPWNQVGGAGVTGNGSQFFDPAWTMFRRLTMPKPYALDYCHNPYVGIVAKCAGDPAVADAGATTPPSQTPPDQASPQGTPDEGGASTPSSSGCACAQTKTTDAGSAPAVLGYVLVMLATGRRATRAPSAARPSRPPRRS